MSTRSWIFIILFLIAALPFFLKIRLPMRSVSPVVRSFYDAIDSLPEGSSILISFDYGPSAMPELHPMASAIIEHAFRKNLKVITIALWPDGHPFSRDIIRTAAQKAGKEYGSDYVALGYMPGLSAVVIGIGDDIRKAFPADADKQPTQNFPILAENNNYEKIGLVVCLAAGATPDLWIAFANARFGEKVLLGVTGVMAANYYPFLGTGQIKGLLGGLRGAMEYEFLLSTPGLATKMMISQNFVHLYIVILVLIGNAIYLFSRFKRGGSR
ncbi:MAG: hypothetical protein V2G33_07665 [bacterium JZ-2024 1]